VVHTSLREGLARVLPQGAISGRPLVSYDVDGAREVVRPVNGFLIPSRDLDALRKAILSLASDREMRETMGREGRDRLAPLFRREIMTDQLRELYQRLLKGRRQD